VNRVEVQRLIDSRTGVITSVTRQPRRPGDPRAFVAYAARVAAVGSVSDGAADPYAFGASLGKPERAWWAAVGEAVERYCGNAMPRRIPVASYRELRDRGIKAVDPASLALYSAQQYAAAGFPFVPFTQDLPTQWVTATDLASADEVRVPASLVYLNPYRQADCTAPRTNFMIYAGIAAGSTRVQAQQYAVEELIERDAVTIWWHSGIPARGIPLDIHPSLCSLLADPVLDQLTFTLLEIPSPFGIPVVGALVEDPTHQIVAFGSACRATPEEAALKAVTEAVQVRALASDLLDPDSPLWRAVRKGTLAAHPYTAHRTDRTYRDAFRADYRDITDLAAQAQLWLDPRLHDSFLDRLRKPPTWADPQQLARVTARAPLSSYIEAFGEAGLSVLCVDLTTPDVRASGLHVVRVVVPGLYGNAPAAFPFLGGERLYTELAKLGLVPRRLREDELVRRPLPYA